MFESRDDQIASDCHLSIRKERYEPISIASSSTTKFVDTLPTKNANPLKQKVKGELKALKETDTENEIIADDASKYLNDETIQESSTSASPGVSLSPFGIGQTFSFKFIESELNKEVHPLEAVALKMEIQILHSDSYNIYVIDAKSPSMIYGKIKDTNNFEEKISHEVETAFSKRNELHFTFFASNLCMVLNEQLWKRGVITKISNGNTEVYLMDYGKVIKCKTEFLMPMLKEWKKTAAQAFPMKLITVEPVTGLVEWSDEACEFLQNTFTKNCSMIKIRPEFKDKMVYGVRIKIGTQSLDKILEDNGMAQRVPCELPQVAQEWKQVSDTNNLAHFFKSPHLKNLAFEICDIPWEKPAMNEFEAYVTNVYSPKKFYCRIYERTKDLKVDQIEMELKEYFTSENTEQSQDLECGSTCAFKLNITSWRRGLIFNVSEESAIIFAIDYGFKYKIPLADVFLLPQTWKKLPAQSLLMQLQYVTPFGQNGLYSQNACDRFKELTNGRLLLIKIVNCSKALYRVLMFDVKSSCDVGGKLVEEGFAKHIFGQRSNQTFSGGGTVYRTILPKVF